MNHTRLPASLPGRHPRSIAFTSSEIKLAADRILSTDCSNARSMVLEILYQFGTLSDRSLFHLVSEQVEVSSNPASFSRLLHRYRNDGLVSPVHPMTLQKVRSAGLRTKEGHGSAYSLGPVGEEYAKRKGWNGENPRLSVTEEYKAHDLICAETMLKMRQLWLELPEDKRGLVDVRGQRALAVWDTEKKTYLIAPDGLLIKHNLSGAFERAFLVEYQNVRALLQVQNKIRKYEQLAKPEYRWV
jgi:hypothetical protein